MRAPAAVFAELMRRAPFQPATNLWRAVELDAVQRHGLPDGRALDVGCGDGRLTALVAALTGTGAGSATRWTGVDIDPAETAQAAAGGFYERVHVGSAAAVPEPSASFDFAFSNSVLEHVGPVDGVLREVARLLRPGGRFIVTVPGPDFHACLAGPARRGADRQAYLDDLDRRCVHLRYWDEATWRAHLRRAGLVLDRAVPYLSQRQVRRWERLSAWTGGLAWRLGGRRARPIEVQRLLRLRGGRDPWLAGSLGAAAAPLLGAGCPLGADDAGAPFGCLLLDARRPS